MRIGYLVSQITDIIVSFVQKLIRALLIWYVKHDSYLKSWSISVDDKTDIRILIDKYDEITVKPSYIKREDALRLACASLCHPGPICPDNKCSELNPLKEAPAEDVRQNVHAEWRKISSSGVYRCSSCGHDVLTNDITNFVFCHRCGAMMGIADETN